ncbi:replication initiation protein [Enterococcus sp. LJL99]
MSELIFNSDKSVGNIDVRRFSVKEMNLIFLICFKVKNEKTNTVTFCFDELKKYTKLKNISIELDDYLKKIMQITYLKEKNSVSKYYILFTMYEVDEKGESVTFFVNPEILDDLRQISNDFDQADLQFFLNIPSSYAKTTYLLTKEMENSKKFTISMESFKKLLDIPKSYKMSDIDKKVFYPIKKDLEGYFDLFDIEKIKYKKDNKIEYLKLNFSKN